MPSVVQWLCDVCYAEGTQQEGTTHLVMLDGNAARSVILCESHEAALLTPLADVLAEHGVRPAVEAPAAKGAKGGSNRQAERLPQGMTNDDALGILDAGRCPFTPSHGPYADRTAAASHMRTTHGLSVTELGGSARGAHLLGGGQGASAPTHNARQRSVTYMPPGEELPCPDCERTFTTAQGLGAHRSRVHGYKRAAPPAQPELAESSA